MSEKIPLVLLTAVLTTKKLWRHQNRTLGDIADIHICELTQHDSVSELAASVLEVAPDQFSLAGISLGGFTAFEIMRRMPERVTRLALLDTNARPDSPDRTAMREKQMALTRQGRFEEVVDQIAPLMVSPGAQSDDSLQDLIREMAMTVGPEGFIRQSTACIHRVDSRPDLVRIDCPTLVVCGRQDQPIPLENSEEIAAGIAGSQLVVVEDCGHLSTLEQPEVVSDALRNWLLS